MVLVAYRNLLLSQVVTRLDVLPETKIQSQKAQEDLQFWV